MDRLTAQEVKKIANYRCEDCGSEQALQWAHILSRRFKTIRWVTQNAFCLCAACHRYYTVHPNDFREFTDRKRGEGTYNLLKQIAYGILPVTSLPTQLSNGN